MKLNIGNQIKYLRKEKDITQEELAEILSVSCQSVSRWETGACYPDMEQLPMISAFFGVTTDKLLGINEAVEQEKAAQYLKRFQESISQGKISDCIAIAREGVSECPNNFALLNKLMYALFAAGDDSGNIPDWKENMEKNDAEITALGERIMKYCPDQNIRLEATARLAFNHCEMDRREIGRAIYDSLPSAEFCRESQMWWGLSEDEKLPFLRDRIKQDYEALRSSLWMLSDSDYVTDEQSIQIMEKLFQLENMVYDGNATPDGWGTARLQLDMAKRYSRLDNAPQAMEHLRRAAAAARDFDDRPQEQSFSSSLLGEITAQKTDFETADTRPLCEIMRDKWLSSHAFDRLRRTGEFKEILNSLS